MKNTARAKRKRYYALKILFLLLFLALALLVCDAAGGLASGLAGGLAFAAAAVSRALLKIASFYRLYTLHRGFSFPKISVYIFYTIFSHKSSIKYKYSLR